MSGNLFLEPEPPKHKLGMLLVVVVAAAMAIGAIWYLASELRGVKKARTKKPAVAAIVPAQPEPPPAIMPTSAPPPVVQTQPPVPAATTATVAAVEKPVPATAVPPPAPAAQPAPPPPVQPEVAPPALDLTKLLAEARELSKNDRCLQARDLCFQVVEKGTNAAVRAEAEGLLGEINVTLAFSKRPMPEKTDYTVQVGDTLGGLAKKFTTTKEMIRHSNSFTGDVIRVGDRFRVLGAKWAVEVNKNRNDLLVTMNDKFFKRYRVGTGQYSMTPTGTFHVVSRIEHPTWYRAGATPVPYGDTNNVLGTHWISLDIPHYGIHGTWETNTIGQQSSQGCIRLLNSNVEELYILLPEGTPVTISE